MRVEQALQLCQQYLVADESILSQFSAGAQVTETANMQILLSPQQYHAVKEHLTNLKRRAKTAQSESVTPDAAR